MIYFTYLFVIKLIRYKDKFAYIFTSVKGCKSAPKCHKK